MPQVDEDTSGDAQVGHWELIVPVRWKHCAQEDDDHRIAELESWLNVERKRSGDAHKSHADYRINHGGVRVVLAAGM
jgi:hypothetical protein